MAASAAGTGLPAACEACRDRLLQLGIDRGGADHVVALAGNPNTGKSTVFNALTGLRQRVGNWPGKTVARAEGAFEYHGERFKLVDLPGTYSLLTGAADEEVARDFVLFGRPDCVVVVADATAVERNLNLILQILQITDRVVVCLNLIDEARRKGIVVDHRSLARDLGVPVMPTAARTGEGLSALVDAIAGMARGGIRTRPRALATSPAVGRALDALEPLVERAAPGLPNARWVAARLLDGDARVEQALADGELGLETGAPPSGEAVQRLLAQAEIQRRGLTGGFRDQVTEAIFADAATMAARAVRTADALPRRDLDAGLDRLLTSRMWGLPIMLLCLAGVFWITIVGANYPSQVLSTALFWIEDQGAALFEALGAPWWLTGFVWEGVWRGVAWVVAVMLPPMAIFFPLFTILENLGYLPRVAFNMDWLFRRVGAHGKQALTMSMGFGCNAAGVIACRVIESPRERLIATLTNNFVPCNGRFPTLIMLANVFVAAEFAAAYASLAAAGAVIGAVLLGIAATLIVSLVLSRTILAGEASSFTLELPPYRRPSIGQILYTSLIDRTLFVLRRAVLMAAPAGGLIWTLNAIEIDGAPLSQVIASRLDPLGTALGLDGVILLAYIIAIPANEIVVPTILMIYTGAGALVEIDGTQQLHDLLVVDQGWTLLTGIALMVFCVLHNPCSTTILTIWKETLSRRWATYGTLIPLSVAFLTTFVLAQTVRML
jgi:ferrous iron transport protein B